MGNNSERMKALLLMTILAIIWGMENVFASMLLTSYSTFTILLCKYMVATVFLTIVMVASGARDFAKPKDIPLFILCGATGSLLYYFFEFSAIKYISVSLATVILTFVPVVSVLIEALVLKRKFNGKLYAGILVTVLGAIFVVGIDLDSLAGGKTIGIVLAFSAVLSWNAYNFVSEKIAHKYHYINIAWTQILCTTIMTLPFGIGGLREAEFNIATIMIIVILGIGGAGCAYMIMPISIKALGPTLTGMFSNLMPIVATIGGWLILNQRITLLQISGTAILIAASCYVIREKGRLEKQT